MIIQRQSLIILALIFSSMSVLGNSKLLKIEKSNLFHLAGCHKELLNPHLGADIYKVDCLNQIGKFENSIKYELIKNSKILIKSDPEIQNQWSLEYLNIFSKWLNNQFGGEEFPIAIIDSGININHEDLNSAIYVNYNEIPTNGIDDDKNGYIDDYFGWNVVLDNGSVDDEFDHGTPIAGIISAAHDNQIGIHGLAPKAKTIIVKMFGRAGGGRTEHAIKAIDYAVSRGAKIINLSWGGYSPSPLLEEVLSRCHRLGVLVVAASGNESNNNDIKPFYPASYNLENIISVAAFDFRGELSSFSNFGLKSVHVSAPGVSVLTTVGEARYGYKEGSSFATPHVAALLNLIWSENKSWNSLEVKKYLLGNCIKTSEQFQKIFCGGYFKF